MICCKMYLLDWCSDMLIILLGCCHRERHTLYPCITAGGSCGYLCGPSRIYFHFLAAYEVEGVEVGVLKSVLRQSRPSWFELKSSLQVLRSTTMQESLFASLDLIYRFNVLCFLKLDNLISFSLAGRKLFVIYFGK